MNKIILIMVFVCLAAGFGIWDYTNIPSAPASDPLPDIQLQSIEGTSYRLYDFKGKVVILNIWATWCAPCIAEFPSLINLAKREQSDLVLIALSVDDTLSDIPAFFERFPDDIQQSVMLENIIIAHDPEKAISKDILGTTLYPETYIIAPDMIVQKKIEGVIDWTDETMRNYLRSFY